MKVFAAQLPAYSKYDVQRSRLHIVDDASEVVEKAATAPLPAQRERDVQYWRLRNPMIAGSALMYSKSIQGAAARAPLT